MATSLHVLSSMRLVVAASTLFVKGNNSPTAIPEVSRTPRFSRTVFCHSPLAVMAVSVPPRSSMTGGFLRGAVEKVWPPRGKCIVCLHRPNRRNPSAAFEKTYSSLRDCAAFANAQGLKETASQTKHWKTICLQKLHTNSIKAFCGLVSLVNTGLNRLLISILKIFYFTLKNV